MKSKILFLVVLSLILGACSTDTVTIEGTLGTSKDEVFTVNQVLPDGVKQLQTFTTKKKGKFLVEIPKPKSAEFISITDGMGDVYLIVDSVTTKLRVQSTDLKKCSVSGNCDSELLTEVRNTLYDLYDASADSVKPYLQRIILDNPKSLCSYYCYFIIFYVFINV